MWRRRYKCFRKNLSPFYWPRFSTGSPAWAVFMPRNPLSAFRNCHRYCFNVKDFCAKVLPAQSHFMDDATNRAGAELATGSEKDRAKRTVIRTAPAGDQHGHAFAAQRVARRINQVTCRERQRVDVLDEIAMLWHDQLAPGFIADPTEAADGRMPIVS